MSNKKKTVSKETQNNISGGVIFREPVPGHSKRYYYYVPGSTDRFDRFQDAKSCAHALQKTYTLVDCEPGTGLALATQGMSGNVNKLQQANMAAQRMAVYDIDGDVSHRDW